jgi:hypothetical protein
MGDICTLLMHLPPRCPAEESIFNVPDNGTCVQNPPPSMGLLWLRDPFVQPSGLSSEVPPRKCKMLLETLVHRVLGQERMKTGGHGVLAVTNGLLPHKRVSKVDGQSCVGMHERSSNCRVLSYPEQHLLARVDGLYWEMYAAD